MELSVFRDSAESHRDDRGIKNSVFSPEDPSHESDEERPDTQNVNVNRNGPACCREKPHEYGVDRKKLGQFGALAFLVITIGLAVVLVLYLADKPLTTTSSSPTPAVTATTPFLGQVTVDASLTIQGTFNDTYMNQSSPEYQKLADLVLTSMNEAYWSSDVGSVYDHTEVIEFRNGSIISVLRSFFREPLQVNGVSSDLNNILREFVTHVRVTINDFINQPRCCNGLLLGQFVVNSAKIVPSPDSPPAIPSATPSKSRPNEPETDQPTLAPTVPSTDPSTDASTDSSTYPQSEPTTNTRTDHSTDPTVIGTATIESPSQTTFAPMTTPEGLSLHFISPNETLSIVSPRYPDNYPVNDEVIWTIQTEMNWKILIRFSSFFTERNFDHFRAWNVDDYRYTENAFFEWSGVDLPNDLISKGNIVWLTFTSDSVFSGKGFSLTATSVPLTDFQFLHFISPNETLSIESPTYPDGYQTGIEVVWIIQTEMNRKILIRFSRLSARYSFFRAGNGDNYTENIFVEMSGSSLPSDLLSIGNTMWLSYTASSFLASGRFSLTATSVPITETITCSSEEFDCGQSVCISRFQECNGINDCITIGIDELECDACNTSSNIAADFNTSVSIFSTHPLGRYNQRNCNWLITAPPSSHIMMHIYSLDITFYVAIYDKDAVFNSDRIGEILGGHHNPGHLVFAYQTISIFYVKSPVDPGFHLGLQAVHSEDYTDCEAYPYAYLSEDRCDGVVQCPNGEDEIGCDCGVDEHVCANGICIGRSGVECDGIVDCMDYSDEGIQCNTSYCVDIENTMCREVLPYNQTYFSNDLGLSQQQANDLIVTHLPQILTNCSDAQHVALCRSIYPACPRFSSNQVCSSACKNALECAGLTGNSSLQCDVYPDQMSSSGDDNSCGFSEDDILNTGDCGTRPAALPEPNPFSRIAGGGESDIANWPWMASYQSTDGNYDCGATLISPQWAVTAAQCRGRDHLVFGSSTSDVPSSYPHIRRIAKSFPHQEYTSTNHNNDIMLLKLDSPVELSDTIRPACLATEDNEAEIYHTCYTVGWGRPAFQGIIKEAILPIQPLEICLNKTVVEKLPFVSHKQICAGDNEVGNSTCAGDEGGPLICRGANGRWKLVGITSTVRYCEMQSTSVFTRVSRYIDFIRYTIATDGRPTHSLLLAASESVNITSPSYPGSYPLWLDVTWVITTETDRALQINISSFGSDPGADIFRVGEGVDFTGESFFQWSGFDSPPLIHSTGNKMWISFTSDNYDSIPMIGFALTVKSILPIELSCNPNEFTCMNVLCLQLSSWCDGVEDCPNGSDESQCDMLLFVGPHFIPPNGTSAFVSPRYPDPYPKEIEVVWIIRTQVNWRILISFSSFSTNKPDDFLRAGNGDNYTENMFFKWYGSELPSNKLSSGNIMWLRFTSDHYYNDRPGFSMTATSVPLQGSLFSHYISPNETLSITSPRYSDDNFPNIVDVVWIIQTEINWKVLIHFESFVGGRFVVFQAGNGDDYTKNTFFDWSRSGLQDNLLAIENVLWLRFTSSVSNALFSLTATSVPLTAAESISCFPADFDCGQSVCIDAGKQCDGFNDCVGGLDELECDACNTSSFITTNFDTPIPIFSTRSRFREYYCHWLVTAPPGSHIMVHIYKLDIVIPRRVYIVILRGDSSNWLSKELTIKRFEGGHHDPGHLVFALQTITIYYTAQSTENAFHLGLQAVRSKDYTECETYPYAYLSEDRCDGIVQCPNGGDEIGCDCGVDEHVCANGICTGRSGVVCDGIVDCMDYSDEGTRCNTTYCVNIENGMCREVLPYNQTYFSNDLGLSQQQANDLIVEHLPRILNNCSKAQQVALCRSIYPACSRFSSERVCSSACKDAMECAGLAGNSSLQCDVYPDQMSSSAEDNSCGFSEDDIMKTGGCGTRPDASPDQNPFSRIIGGGESDIASWPWVASFRHSSGQHVCGATLISPQWAVTAAHCRDLDHLVFGSSTSDVPSSYPHIRSIAKEFTHPEYTSPNYNNDIKLLKLSSPVELSDTIRPACLATEDNEAEIYHNCHAVGWGSTAFQGSTSRVIKEAVLPIQPPEMCRNNTAVTRILFVSHKQICAGYNEAGNSICHGDSGGPLICRGTNGRWKLVGITSTTNDCGERSTPSVFTRVSRFIDFIRYTIASDGRPTHSLHLAASESVNITSPSYPGSYPVWLDVTWVITTETDRALQIIISSFDTDPYTDIFRAGEGVDFTGKSFFQWSGVDIPQVFHSTGSELWMSFTPDNYVSTPRNGFAMTVQSVHQSEFSCNSDEFYCKNYVCISLTSKCDYRKDCPDGSDESQCGGPFLLFKSPNEDLRIVSPKYPDNYPEDVEIVWIIQTEINWKILISFSSFSLKYGDYFRAGNGDDYLRNRFFEESNILFTSNVVVSSGNIMWLSFTSNSYFSDKGFSLTAINVPATGGSFSHFVSPNKTFSIVSPRYPDNYPIGIEVVWIIQTEINWKILISFSRFSISYSDFFGAGNGDNHTENMFFEWSLGSFPNDLLSTGNIMWLSFTCKSTYSLSGFFFFTATSVPLSG